MKYLFVILVFFISGCATQQIKQPKNEQGNQITVYENKQKGIDSIIANKALKSFKNEYLKAAKNRAFAQSLSGAWNWRSDRTSAEHAKTSALIACQRHNKKAEEHYPCKVIHVNDAWAD